jgi:hypothetical protein
MTNYVSFLNNSLPFYRRCTFEAKQSEDILYDWLQANWEMVIESALFYGSNRFLPIYGQGADLAAGSSRVSNPKAIATDKIYCTSRELVFDYISKTNIDVEQLEFEEFVSWDGDGDWYSINNTLDHILLSDDDDEYVVLIKKVRFALKSA